MKGRVSKFHPYFCVKYRNILTLEQILFAITFSWAFEQSSSPVSSCSWANVCMSVSSFLCKCRNMSKCFISHPARDMYCTLIHLLKCKQEIKFELYMIKTKCMRTIYVMLHWTENVSFRAPEWPLELQNAKVTKNKSIHHEWQSQRQSQAPSHKVVDSAVPASPASQFKTIGAGKGNFPGTQQAHKAHTALVAAIQKGDSPTAAQKLLPPFLFSLCLNLVRSHFYEQSGGTGLLSSNTKDFSCSTYHEYCGSNYVNIREQFGQKKVYAKTFNRGLMLL